MKSSREFDVVGHNFARTQAALFSEASEKGIGSFFFLRRFAHSSYCEEFDTRSLRSSASTNAGFFEEHEPTLPKRGEVLPPDVMHWIGYLYRYWCYVEAIPLRRLMKRVKLSYLKTVYNAYHTVGMEETVTHIKEALNIDGRVQRVIEKYRPIYRAIFAENASKSVVDPDGIFS